MAFAEDKKDEFLAEVMANCDRDTFSINVCAGQKSGKVEAKLKDLLGQQLARLKNEESKKRLLSSQEKWEEFRKTDCEYQTWATKGGSIHLSQKINCMTAHAETRIIELEKFIACTYAGCPW